MCILDKKISLVHVTTGIVQVDFDVLIEQSSFEPLWNRFIMYTKANNHSHSKNQSIFILICIIAWRTYCNLARIWAETKTRHRTSDVINFSCHKNGSPPNIIFYNRPVLVTEIHVMHGSISIYLTISPINKQHVSMVSG